MDVLTGIFAHYQAYKDFIMADTIVVANQTLFGEYCANVFCFSNIVQDIPSFQTFADNFRASWAAGFAGAQTNQWTLESLTFQVIDVDSVVYSIELSFTSGPLVGGQAAEALANQTSLLVSTLYVGAKPNRGRTYLLGLTETSLVNGLFSASVVASAEALVQDFVDGTDDGNGLCFMRILRRPSNVFPAYVSSPISSVIGRNNPATQRSRRRG